MEFYKISLRGRQKRDKQIPQIN